MLLFFLAVVRPMSISLLNEFNQTLEGHDHYSSIGTVSL